MKNILVPIAASTKINSTLQYAIDFASHFNAKVYVLGDYNLVSRAGSMINVDEKLEQDTKAHLNEVIGEVNTKGVEIATVVAKGNLIDIIKDVTEELKIDLAIIESNSSINNKVFLDNNSGAIIKQTEIPSIMVPCTYTFKPPTSLLIAFKSGVLRRKKVLSPLKAIYKTFNPKTNLLLVKTPKTKDEDMEVNSKLKAYGEVTTTENATTFQGVLEHFHQSEPDMLCVFRRKRGFFTKLWEKNIILKEEFHCKIPVLVLIGKL